MRRALLVVVFLAALIPLSSSAPVKGSITRRFELGPGRGGEISETFRGGQRACALARDLADNKNVDIALFVYDAAGALITKQETAGPLVAVIWYPPRDGVYKIQVNNPSSEAVACYLALK